jgi:dihydrofolate synthase/folylpolyglutamate synthase
VAADPSDWLFSLAQFGIKFGLDNIRAIVGALGHPERRYRALHVAGTNGKGSVTAMVDAALRSAGYRTGCYTSPHLLDLTERFAVDGNPVGREALASVLADVRTVVTDLLDAGRLEVHPTFFEVTTAAAFELFSRQQVEIATFEVGLGGRLDATNVLTPMVSAITSIGLDHEQYLGSTIGDIAREKAGIIKPGVPVVVGRVTHEAAAAIAAVAEKEGAPLTWAVDGVTTGTPEREADGTQRFELSTPVREYGSVHLGLAGAHQVDNAIVAVRLLETLDTQGVSVGPDAIVAGLATVSWPGRLQRIRTGDGREALLDAAHNIDGARALAAHLQDVGQSGPLVVAVMRDKDAASMLRVLAPVVTRVIATRASNPRSMEPAELAALARRVLPGVAVEVEPSVGDALTRAWSHATFVVVAGSIFLLADAMKELRRP